MVFLFNRFRRGYRYSRNRFRRGYRYSRKSVPAWIPFPKEFGSGVDTDIPGNRLQRGRRYSRDIGSGVNTESQRFEWASEDRKTKIRRVDFRRIDEPRFVSASRWIYRIRLSVLGFGYMEFGFRFLGLDIWVSTFGWALDIWVSTFGSWALNIRISAFDYWALDIWVSSFDYWALDIRVSTFSSQALDMWVSTFGWVLDIWVSFHFGFLVGFSFGLLLNGFLFRTLSDRVSRR
ncbi:unnamed protein product [Rhizophagus irregularis]|nr:unnamed protein product [Rhizophagus irregularis]